MSVMFVLLPVALAFAAGALAVFLWAARTGQFDDLDTPPVRVLIEDDMDIPAVSPRRTSARGLTETPAPRYEGLRRLEGADFAALFSWQTPCIKSSRWVPRAPPRNQLHHLGGESMIARDVMTKDPITLSEQATVEDAADLMQERDIRHVPIVDRSGALVGIVSDRDLGSLDLGSLIGDAGIDGLRAHLATPVVKVMTPEVITVGPEDGLDDLVDLMLESRVGAVPVVEEHSRRVIGIVSYVDVLRAFRTRQG